MMFPATVSLFSSSCVALLYVLIATAQPRHCEQAI
jgi:hypothetical protein